MHIDPARKKAKVRCLGQCSAFVLVVRKEHGRRLRLSLGSPKHGNSMIRDGTIVMQNDFLAMDLDECIPRVGEQGKLVHIFRPQTKLIFLERAIGGRECGRRE